MRHGYIADDMPYSNHSLSKYSLLLQQIAKAFIFELQLVAANGKKTLRVIEDTFYSVSRIEI
jgi:hypothetical protein